MRLENPRSRVRLEKRVAARGRHSVHRDRSPAQGEDINTSEVSVDVWCIKDPKAPDPAHPERCAGLQQLKNGFQVPDIAYRVPSSERGDNVPISLTSDIKALTIRFHDLDSEQGTSPEKPPASGMR